MTLQETANRSVTAQQLARALGAELYASILAQEADVRRGEVEAIHDMRVATRRLRVVLANFAVCWTKAERRQIKQWLQGLADALGAVRDLDVLLATLRRQRAQLAPSERPLVTALLQRLRQQRRRRQAALLVYLESAAYRDFKQDFPAYVATQPEALAAAAN